MPQRVSRSGQFLEKEILKYGQIELVKKSVVLDANFFAMPTDPTLRNVVPAGTILKLSVTNPKQYVAYDGAGRIEGILFHSVEILAAATAGAEAVPMVHHDAIFATTAIVGFTNYASALVSTLNTCKWE